MEKRKQSRKPVLVPPATRSHSRKAIYLSLLTHRSVITQLRAEKRHLEDEVDELKRILKELSEGYNPNYQVRALVFG
jgi:predicted RNase H-like nuclease (RuvC/YqgF family)